MNKLSLWLGSTILFAGFFCNAQEILTVKEKYSGKTQEIEGANPIVDINSSLELSLSKEELRKTIITGFPNLAEQIELEQEISALENALENQNLILQILKQEIASIDDQDEFFVTIGNFFKTIEKSGLEGKVNELYDQFYNQGMDSYYKYPEIFIFEILTTDLQELRKGLEETELSPLQISLVGFKKDKQGGNRVHIQNFDTYKDGEYTVIERWVTTLTPQNQEKIKRISEFTSENKTLNRDIFSSLKFSIEKNFQDMECLKELKLDLDRTISDKEKINNLSKEIQEIAIELNSDLGKLISMGNLISTNISQWDITTPFVLSEQFLNFYNSNKSFEESLKANVNEIDQIITSIPELQDFKQQILSCTEKILNNLETLKSTIEFQKLQQRNYIESKNIGEEVIKFGLDNLPEIGIIDLKKIGSRSNGDELEINVMLRRPSKDEQAPDQDILLEQTNLSLQMIGLHSQVVVGLIMANPFEQEVDQNVDTNRRFFYAPAASLLLKFGSRDWKFFNDFFNPGIGINFASPDFDIDGNPEFGTGIIVTALKDILSIGINYNVTLDVSYWFFGINLPFNLPGIPVTGVGRID